jgi:hypothetical protein
MISDNTLDIWKFYAHQIRSKCLFNANSCQTYYENITYQNVTVYAFYIHLISLTNLCVRMLVSLGEGKLHVVKII